MCRSRSSSRCFAGLVDTAFVMPQGEWRGAVAIRQLLSWHTVPLPLLLWIWKPFLRCPPALNHLLVT